jgi:hypothetical protein
MACPCAHFEPLKCGNINRIRRFYSYFQNTTFDKTSAPPRHTYHDIRRLTVYQTSGSLTFFNANVTLSAEKYAAYTFPAFGTIADNLRICSKIILSETSSYQLRSLQAASTDLAKYLKFVGSKGQYPMALK